MNPPYETQSPRRTGTLKPICHGLNYKCIFVNVIMLDFILFLAQRKFIDIIKIKSYDVNVILMGF